MQLNVLDDLAEAMKALDGKKSFDWKKMGCRVPENCALEDKSTVHCEAFFCCQEFHKEVTIASEPCF
jgi:hypothetical protein